MPAANNQLNSFFFHKVKAWIPARGLDKHHPITAAQLEIALLGL